jgi:hypothetical protein
METKQCTKCKYQVPIEYFLIKRGKHIAMCSPCASLYNNPNINMCRVKYLDKDLNEQCLKASNRIHALLNSRKYRKANPERVKESAMKQKIKNPNRGAKVQKKVRDELRDSYIITALTNDGRIKREDVTSELIELKRKQLKLYRDVKREESNQKNN